MYKLEDDLVETWKALDPIKYSDYEIYQVSSWGRVRSVDRIYEYENGKKLERRRYMRRLFVCARGFVSVTLFNTSTKKNRTFRVHRLVADTFLAESETSRHVLHIDGNRKNNKRSNLMFVRHISKDTYTP